MSNLIIQSPLADRLRELASREKRAVEDLLADLLALYQPAPYDEVDTRLVELGIIAAPSIEKIPPPMSEQESLELADRIGRAGPLSPLIIEERQKGP